MSAIVTSTDVDRPADEVFAHATDPTRFVEWQGGVTGGHMDSTDRGPQIGDVCVTIRRIGGAERAAASRLVTFDPPRAWAVRGTDGPIRALVDLTVVPWPDDRAPAHSGGCRPFQEQFPRARWTTPVPARSPQPEPHLHGDAASRLLDVHGIDQALGQPHPPAGRLLGARLANRR
jgi:polyketide cyclase/dehydrase/lipid transport protein